MDDLDSVIGDMDVVYMTRIQKERFQDRPQDYEKAIGRFIIGPESMKLLPPTGCVMHPLPRVDEVRRGAAFLPRVGCVSGAVGGVVRMLAFWVCCVSGTVRNECGFPGPASVLGSTA